jgi:peptidoglycan/LPS O-acetylase OafA/YrhL
LLEIDPNDLDVLGNRGFAYMQSHKAVAFIVNTQLARWMLPPGLKPLLIACACVTVGWLLFRLIETPFMACRDRLFPTSFSTERRHTLVPVLAPVEARVDVE